MNTPSNPLVTAAWLFENMNTPGLKIIESKLKPIGAQDNWETGQKIPGALLLDIEDDFSDKKSAFPHTLLGESEFSQRCSELGLTNNDTLVIYDQVGVYSSPRTWWMFKTMGHEQVYVLDGGIQAWISKGFITEKAHWAKPTKSNYVAKFNSDLFLDTDHMLDILGNQTYKILDARSKGRFEATAPEPRPGMRGGHIPGSDNLPFEQVLNGIFLKSENELKGIFSKLIDSNQKLITTCGSGVTASIIAFAAYIAGYQNFAVYDGSWAEWGRPCELPVEV